MVALKCFRSFLVNKLLFPFLLAIFAYCSSARMVGLNVLQLMNDNTAGTDSSVSLHLWHCSSSSTLFKDFTPQQFIPVPIGGWCGV